MPEFSGGMNATLTEAETPDERRKRLDRLLENETAARASATGAVGVGEDAVAGGIVEQAPLFDPNKDRPIANQEPNTPVPDPVDNDPGGFQDAQQDPDNVSEADLLNSLLSRAEAGLAGGNPVTQEDLDRQRALGNQATAEEVANLQAQFGAGGFGASAAAGLAASDISRLGAQQTEEAVSSAARAGREEQLQRIIASADMALAGVAGVSAAERDALINKLIQQELDAGNLAQDPGPGGGLFDDVDPDDSFIEQGMTAAQELLDKALGDGTTENAGDFIGEASEGIGNFFSQILNGEQSYPELPETARSEGFALEWSGQNNAGETIEIWVDPETGDRYQRTL